MRLGPYAITLEQYRRLMEGRTRNLTDEPITPSSRKRIAR